MSDLDRLAADLGKASAAVVGRVTKVVAKGAGNVKDDARKMSSGLSHAPHYPRSIGYDMDFSAGKVAADIGPDKSMPQGALGNLLTYGSVNNAPRPHLGPALEKEAPRFVKEIADAARDIL